jgi:signal transduction histidine kinase/CheY-like chemotaxis protein
MKTLLILSESPQFPDSVGAAVDPAKYRILHRSSIQEAEPLLAHSLADVCIADLAKSGVEGVWLVERIRQHAPSCPIIAFTASPEWEEEAYVKGASYVLQKLVQPRTLNALLERLLDTGRPEASATTSTALVHPESSQISRPTEFFTSPVNQQYSQTVGFLRSFSGILTHALDAEAMLRQFLLFLREILGINRAVIFLAAPNASLDAKSASGKPTRKLEPMCSIGIDQDFLRQLNFSLDAGIGALAVRHGRVLRRKNDEALNDPLARREFELINAQVAVPILDREKVIGFAAFDARITGEPLVNAELELIFHLLEQAGLAIRNTWLHAQLSANNQLMAGVLKELSSGCIVVNSDLSILHANKAARRLLGSTAASAEMGFADLPPEIGSKIFQVLKTGSAIANFRFEPDKAKGAVYNINIVPFPGASSDMSSALLMVEDLSQTEQLRDLEVEASSLRLIRSMADRLTHEIGNAMVPISTHQQLLNERWKDPEFRSSLDGALSEGVKRVTRLVNQMRFLARDSLLAQDSFPLGPVIEEAYTEARKYYPSKSGQLKYESGGQPVTVKGDRTALRYAFTEVILNALQANPAEPIVGVRLNSIEGNGNGHTHPSLRIEIRDNGAGFTSETAQKAVAPFFTTRNVGLGLGLTVSRKIIETHHGRLEIAASQPGQPGVVRISLPVAPK